MKDEQDPYMQDMHDTAKPTPKRGRKRLERPFVADEQAEASVQAGRIPEVAKARRQSAMPQPYFVPVSFVAKDWGVSSRRVRALLASGRLLGNLLPNGYWEVRYPYLYSEGLRGPAPKRHQRPVPRRKDPEAKAAENEKPC